MSILLKEFGDSVRLEASEHGLTLSSTLPVAWSAPEAWPESARQTSAGRRTAFDVATMLEMGLAQQVGSNVVLAYSDFPAIVEEEFSITSCFAQPSPFLLKIDRVSDIGRSDFRYKYQYLLGRTTVPLTRCGYFVHRKSTGEVFRLDERMYRLVDAMDSFNVLPAELKQPQRSWMDFANIKRWSSEVNAILDSTLAKNDVVVPSSIGLDLFEDPSGALSFFPTCPELDHESFRTVFDRNNDVEGFYSLDQPGMGRVRIVLTDKQTQVLERMKRVRRVTGETKKNLIEEPGIVFDGLAGDVELPYGDRVTGIGTFEFVSIPKAQDAVSPMSALFDGYGAGGGKEGDAKPEHTAEDKPEQKALLIETHDEVVCENYLQQAEQASSETCEQPFECPKSLRSDRQLKRHQEDGVRWLQTCSRIEGRKGVLLADDMGLGKTLQILTFLAWCIESGQFPDLTHTRPPFRPILIVAPLILLETHTWEESIREFFDEHADVFGNVLPLYGPTLRGFRRSDAEGRESFVAKPILDLDRIRRHQVVITNYEAVRDYEFSFAYCIDGKSLWSVVVTDEAQEYKTPNSKISHAMKALQPDFRIACTGTPVENRLLDLWNLFDAAQPGLLGSSKEFTKTYEVGDDTVLCDLKSRLLYQRPHAFLLRRNKQDVLELPPKREHKVECVMSATEVQQHSDLINNLDSAHGNTGKLALLQRFSRMYQHPALLHGTGDEETVDDLIQQSSKLQEVLAVLHQIRGQREKAIVFARHKDVQRMLARVFSSEFKTPVRIVNGDTPKSASLSKTGAASRSKILEEFRQSRGFDVLILSPFVAGVGLTIVEANHVIHYGRWWNPAVEAQATDRAYRIGQTKEVHVYLPILKDSTGAIAKSFDELLDDLMEGKKELATGILQHDDFLRPKEDPNESGLRVFNELEASRGR